jgi:lipopolysaccharide export system permease protein
MRTMDAYTLRRLLKPLGLIVAVFTGIFIIVDLFDNAHSFIDNQAPIGAVVGYYIYYLPLIVVLTSPIAMLLATLLAVGGLARRNEIMALKGSGVSLYRILTPVLALAVAVSLANVLIGELILPDATRHRLRIKQTSITRRASDTLVSEPLFVTPDGTMFIARRLNTTTNTLEDVTVERFDRQFVPTIRVDATSAVWEKGTWVFYDGTRRVFSQNGDQVTSFERLDSGDTEPNPDELGVRKLEPDEMPYRELRSYILKLRASGRDPRRLAVQLQLKIAFPFVTIIMTLLGGALAAGARRSGFALAFTAALAVSFFYYGVIQVGQVLGRQGMLVPWLAAWISNFLFAGVGAALPGAAFGGAIAPPIDSSLSLAIPWSISSGTAWTRTGSLSGSPARYSQHRAWLAKLMSMTDAGWPSAAERFIKRPSPRRLMRFPPLTTNVSTDSRGFLTSVDISLRACLSISTSKCPEFATTAPSFIASKCRAVMTRMSPVSVTKMSPIGAASSMGITRKPSIVASSAFSASTSVTTTDAPSPLARNASPLPHQP